MGVEPIEAWPESSMYGRGGPTRMQGLGFLGLAVHKDSDEVYVFTTAGIFQFHHSQDCCEEVVIQDVNVTGEPVKAIGEPIAVAEVRTEEGEGEYGHWTATFYAIRTPSLDIDMNWRGESNGYYSENVDIALTPWTAEMLRDLASTHKGQRVLVALDAWQEIHLP